MYEPYFPPPEKPQDGYGHISLHLAIVVTNQSFKVFLHKSFHFLVAWNFYYRAFPLHS